GIARLRHHEDVGDIGKGPLIGDDAGKADLLFVAVEPEGKRMADNAAHDPLRDAAREKVVNECDVETARVGVDPIAPAADDAGGDNTLVHRSYPKACLGDDRRGETTAPALRPRQRRRG